MVKKTSNDKVLRLPASAINLFEHYRNLHIQDLEIVCPYHINTGLRGKSRALVGKGRPEEIEAAAYKYMTKFQMHVDGDPERLNRYMMACGLGIDCSGFAAWMLNTLTIHKLNKPLQRVLVFPSRKRSVIGKFRPYENISANLLTSSANSRRIDNIDDIRPGDLIRLINGGHVVIISEVGFKKDGSVDYFKYMQSTVGYGHMKGVEEDTVKVKDSKSYLLGQKWNDNLIYEAIEESGIDARIVRLKALAD